MRRGMMLTLVPKKLKRIADVAEGLYVIETELDLCKFFLQIDETLYPIGETTASGDWLDVYLGIVDGVVEADNWSHEHHVGEHLPQVLVAIDDFLRNG